MTHTYTYIQYLFRRRREKGEGNEKRPSPQIKRKMLHEEEEETPQSTLKRLIRMSEMTDKGERRSRERDREREMQRKTSRGCCAVSRGLWIWKNKVDERRNATSTVEFPVLLHIACASKVKKDIYYGRN